MHDVIVQFFDFVDPHLFIAAVLGGLIGLERELAGKDPSLRTFTLISLGSCVFSMISVDASMVGPHGGDAGRIAAQVVSGIGFLGAGVIFRGSSKISGFTTAALMWFTAGVGMAVGFHQTRLATSATVVALVFTYALRAVHAIVERTRGEKPVPRGEQLD